MKNIWSLQDAKNQFSRVVDEAQKEGPQIVTKRGVESVVVLSMKDYKKLTKPSMNLVEFFKKSPLHGIDIELKRSKTPAREIAL